MDIRRLSACMPLFEQSAGSLSCSDSASDQPTSSVAALLGVTCMDANIIVDLPTLQGHNEYADFQTQMEADAQECTSSLADTERLRSLQAGMCDAVDDTAAESETSAWWWLSVIAGSLLAVVLSCALLGPSDWKARAMEASVLTLAACWCKRWTRAIQVKEVAEGDDAHDPKAGDAEAPAEIGGEVLEEVGEDEEPPLSRQTDGSDGEDDRDGTRTSDPLDPAAATGRAPAKQRRFQRKVTSVSIANRVVSRWQDYSAPRGMLAICTLFALKNEAINLFSSVKPVVNQPSELLVGNQFAFGEH